MKLLLLAGGALAAALTGHDGTAQYLLAAVVVAYTWPQMEANRAVVRRWLGELPEHERTRP